MIYRRMGRSGLQLSALSFGAWVTFGHQVDDSVADACLGAAYDAGVNFFDNAEVYAHGQGEIVMGRLLARHNWPRETWCVSSKVFWGDGTPGPNARGCSRKHIVEACHKALKRLQVEHLDIYMCHRCDPHTPMDEVVFAMNDLIRQGKVLYWGTSEWNAQQLQEAETVARDYRLIGPSAEQPEYNMFRRARVELELKPLCEKGLGLTIWSPLASGLLTGKYNAGVPADSRLNFENYKNFQNRLAGDEGQWKLSCVSQLARLADEIGLPLPRLALAWCLLHPHISTVMTGASKASQVVENMKAIDDLTKLTPAIVQRIENILGNKPVAPPLV